MSKHEKWKDIPRDIIPFIIKIEAFKIIFPDRYEKLLNDLQPDIEQMIAVYSQTIKETIWH